MCEMGLLAGQSSAPVLVSVSRIVLETVSMHHLHPQEERAVSILYKIRHPGPIDSVSCTPWTHMWKCLSTWCYWVIVAPGLL